MVFYFTGTGNSLYIARQPDPVSIPQVMARRAAVRPAWPASMPAPTGPSS